MAGEDRNVFSEITAQTPNQTKLYNISTKRTKQYPLYMLQLFPFQSKQVATILYIYLAFGMNRREIQLF
jgi:hypothetical protein